MEVPIVASMSLHLGTRTQRIRACRRCAGMGAPSSASTWRAPHSSAAAQMAMSLCGASRRVVECSCFLGTLFNIVSTSQTRHPRPLPPLGSTPSLTTNKCAAANFIAATQTVEYGLFLQICSPTAVSKWGRSLRPGPRLTISVSDLFFVHDVSCVMRPPGIVASECVVVEGALYTVSNDLTFRQHDVASGACRRTLNATGKFKFSAVCVPESMFHIAHFRPTLIY